MEKEWREEGVEEKKVMVSLLVFVIDPMQKWLPLNYYFVHIQNSPTNLVLRQKFKRICYPERGQLGYFEYEQKNNLKAPIFA